MLTSLQHNRDSSSCARLVASDGPHSHHQLAILFTLAAIVVGCDNSFTPKGEITEFIAVYCVLDAGSSMQVVRLARSYDPPGVRPDEFIGSKEVCPSSVTMSDGSRVIAFRDTTFIGADGRSHPCYVASFRPQSIKTYSLTVAIDSFNSLKASVRVPPLPGMTMNGFRTVFHGDEATGLRFSAEGAAFGKEHPYGSQYTATVEYEHETNGRTDTLTMEIPESSENRGGYTVPVYPTLRRDLFVNYSWHDFIETMRTIKKNGDRIVPYLTCRVICFDEASYRYIKSVRGFDDPLSVRTESIDYTNIPGGKGILGAVTCDTIRVKIPGSVLITL